jgi:hypothetical protein
MLHEKHKYTGSFQDITADEMLWKAKNIGRTDNIESVSELILQHRYLTIHDLRGRNFLTKAVNTFYQMI